MTENCKKFLLTAARSTSTIDLARQLNILGHEVFCADTTPWHICQLSNGIKKNYVIPRPRFATQAFIHKLCEIITTEKIDYLIPTYEEILYISKHLHHFPKSCTIICDDFNKIHNLHNKWLFYLKQKDYQIDVPNAVLIQNTNELYNISLEYPFVLKASYSRASQSLIKVNSEEDYKKLHIEPHNPWIAQEWVTGKKYCTYSVCQAGKVVAHAVYPVEFTIDGNSCINFESITHPKIYEWITNLAALENFTGQIGFDFIEQEDGRLLAIECNPRATNGLLLFQPEDRLDLAFMNQTTTLICPKEGYRKQIMMGMLIYGWKSAYHEGLLIKYFKTLCFDKDVIFSTKDLKPFIFMPFLFLIYIFQKIKMHLSIPAMFLFDFNWDGEEHLRTFQSKSIPRLSKNEYELNEPIRE